MITGGLIGLFTKFGFLFLSDVINLTDGADSGHQESLGSKGEMQNVAELDTEAIWPTWTKSLLDE